MSTDQAQRGDFMTEKDKRQMKHGEKGAIARSHAMCLKLTGKRRPGKTAKDRAGNRAAA